MGQIILFRTKPRALADAPFENFAQRCYAAAQDLAAAVQELETIATRLALPAPRDLIQEGNGIVSALRQPDQLVDNPGQRGEDLIRRTSQFDVLVSEWVRHQLAVSTP